MFWQGLEAGGWLVSLGETVWVEEKEWWVQPGLIRKGGGTLEELEHEGDPCGGQGGKKWFGVGSLG